MLAQYLFQPEGWYRHHYGYARSVVHRIALGERLVKPRKQLADLQDVITHFVGNIGTSLVNWFPELDMQLMEAGSDTTREVLNIFAMAALCYPGKVQKPEKRLILTAAPGRTSAYLVLISSKKCHIYALRLRNFSDGDLFSLSLQTTCLCPTWSLRDIIFQQEHDK